MIEEIENELFTNDELQDDDIDYAKLREVMDAIGEEREQLEKSLSPEELDIIETARQIEGLCNEILEERLETAKNLDEMTEEEAIEFYNNLTSDTSKFIEKLNLKSVTVEDIANDKLNDERDE